MFRSSLLFGVFDFDVQSFLGYCGDLDGLTKIFFMLSLMNRIKVSETAGG